MAFDSELERRLRALLDEHDVTDVLYRYGSTIDVKDFDALRSILADDVVGQYGDYPQLRGADALVEWIRDSTRDRAWQHHKLTVYHVDIDGDLARALTYHTSHQIATGLPDVVNVVVARYHDELRRTPDGWKITRKVMEVGWREERTRAAHF